MYFEEEIKQELDKVLVKVMELNHKRKQIEKKLDSICLDKSYKSTQNYRREEFEKLKNDFNKIKNNFK